VVEVLFHYWNPDLASKLQVIASLVPKLEQRADAPRPVRRRLTRLTEAQAAKLVTGYSEHVPVNELAGRFRLSRQTVSAILRRRGVELHQLGLSPSEAAEAARLYRHGWSLAKLARKFGVDGMTVRRYLLVEGVVMRGPNDR